MSKTHDSQLGEMGVPLACRGPLCGIDHHHPLCKLYTPDAVSADTGFPSTAKRVIDLAENVNSHRANLAKWLDKKEEANRDLNYIACRLLEIANELQGSRQGLSLNPHMEFGPLAQAWQWGFDRVTDGLISNLPFDIFDAAYKEGRKARELLNQQAVSGADGFDAWIKRKYPWLGPIGDGVAIAREAWGAALAQQLESGGVTNQDCGVTWADAQKLVAMPAVDEALEVFCNGRSAENALALVRAVMIAQSNLIGNTRQLDE